MGRFLRCFGVVMLLWIILSNILIRYGIYGTYITNSWLMFPLFYDLSSIYYKIDDYFFGVPSGQ